jgi:hypothetical protein
MISIPIIFQRHFFHPNSEYEIYTESLWRIGFKIHQIECETNVDIFFDFHLKTILNTSLKLPAEIVNK